jgi:Domain of unknown function (DUF4360)
VTRSTKAGLLGSNAAIRAGASLALFAALQLGDRAAAAEFRFGQPTFAGDGCQGTTVSATLSPDQSSALSVLFSGMIADTTGNRFFKRKRNCRVTIPVTPSEIVLGFNVNYRGAQSLPEAGRSSLKIEYRVSSGDVSRGPAYRYQTVGPINEERTFAHSIDTRWDSPPRATTLRIDIAIAACPGEGGGTSLATLDSIDVTPRKK